MTATGLAHTHTHTHMDTHAHTYIEILSNIKWMQLMHSIAHFGTII